MSQIMKTFTGLVMVLWMGAAAVGILSMCMKVILAQNLQSSVSCRLSEGAFAPGVIEECLAEAENAGEELEIILYTGDGRRISITDRTMIPQDCTSVVMAQSRLTFTLKTAIPKTSRSYTIQSYTR